jgi:hypothetical protein
MESPKSADGRGRPVASGTAVWASPRTRFGPPPGRSADPGGPARLAEPCSPGAHFGTVDDASTSGGDQDCRLAQRPS